jgi:hypothetical protein
MLERNREQTIIREPGRSLNKKRSIVELFEKR